MAEAIGDYTPATMEMPGELLSSVEVHKQRHRSRPNAVVDHILAAGREAVGNLI